MIIIKMDVWLNFHLENTHHYGSTPNSLENETDRDK